jgi:tRNA/tmRNA/rRNA uracil-C5-methylase (TrmA/RlmC/RlmD family)
VKRGDLVVMRADSMLPSGAAVSQIADRELVCHGLFPGEQGQVRIDAVSRQAPRAFASLVRRESAHPARREAACQNHEARGGACGGCALMELSESAQREEKRALLAQRFGLGVREVEHVGPELGYRYSSKRVALNVGGGEARGSARAQNLVLGSYARESHAPAAMAGCLVDHPRLVSAFDEVERVGRALGVAPFDERGERGDLRAVWAKTNGEQVIVTLVVRSAEGLAATRLAQALAQADGVLVSVHEAPSNNLRGAPAALVKGVGELSLELLGQRVGVGALGFLQPNPAAAALAYRALLAPSEDAEGGAHLAFDLYAGAGVTTRALAAQFAEVVACEAHPESAAALGIAAESCAAFLARELARPARRAVDLVIANPPRKGLGPEVVTQLLSLDARALRIMSCGPEGLARDLAGLTEGGRYTLRSLRAFDTLPQTPHVELVAVLTRARLVHG